MPKSMRKKIHKVCHKVPRKSEKKASTNWGKNQRAPKIIPNLMPKCMQKRSQIYPKFTKYCIWGTLGGPLDQSQFQDWSGKAGPDGLWPHFGNQFRRILSQKSKNASKGTQRDPKKESKNGCQNRCRKNVKNCAKILPTWWQNGRQNGTQIDAISESAISCFWRRV